MFYDGIYIKRDLIRLFIVENKNYLSAILLLKMDKKTHIKNIPQKEK